jgi:hypothetical protein
LAAFDVQHSIGQAARLLQLWLVRLSALSSVVVLAGQKFGVITDWLDFMFAPLDIGCCYAKSLPSAQHLC